MTALRRTSAKMRQLHEKMRVMRDAMTSARSSKALPEQTAFVEQGIVASSDFPGRITACSSLVGWKSLFVRAYRSPATVGLFTTRPASHVHVALAVGGSVSLDGRSERGPFRLAYGSGVACIHTDETATAMAWAAVAQADVETIHVYIPRRTFVERCADDAHAEASLAQAQGLVIEHDTGLVQAGVELTRAIARGEGEEYAAVAEAYFTHHVLSALGRKTSGECYGVPSRIVGNSTSARFDRLLAKIDESYALDLPLEALASDVGVSISHLIELFKQRVGITPHRHITRVRLLAATRLLRDRDRPIGSIAEAVGFADAARFSAAFKQRYAVTPTSYRCRADDHGSAPLLRMGAREAPVGLAFGSMRRRE